jgi:hypothetical protein
MTSDIDAFIYGSVLGLPVFTCIRTYNCTVITAYCYLQYEFDALFNIIAILMDYNVSEFKTAVFRMRSSLFWPWVGGECGALYAACLWGLALPGSRTSTPRCPSPCQPTTDGKSVIYVRTCSALQCGVPVVRATPPSVIRSKISSQLPVSQMVASRRD